MSVVRVMSTLELDAPRLARRWVELGGAVTVGPQIIVRLTLVWILGIHDDEDPALRIWVETPHGHAFHAGDLSERFSLPGGLEMIVRAVSYAASGRPDSLLVEFRERPRRSYVVY